MDPAGIELTTSNLLDPYLFIKLKIDHHCSWRCPTVYPKKYAHGFVVLCFVVVMQSFIMNSHEVFIHIHQGCFAGTGAIVRLPQCQWSKPDGYGKISQYITTTKHSKAKTMCIFLGIYCNSQWYIWIIKTAQPSTTHLHISWDILQVYLLAKSNICPLVNWAEQAWEINILSCVTQNCVTILCWYLTI